MRVFTAILFFAGLVVNAQDLASNDVKLEDNKCYQTVTGEVRDRVTNDLLPNTIVSIQDDEGNPIASQMVKRDGIFTFKVTCNTDYRLKAMKKSYTLESKKFKTTNALGAELKTKILLDKGSISFIKKSKSVEARKAQTASKNVENVSTSDMKPITSVANTNTEEKVEVEEPVTTKEIDTPVVVANKEAKADESKEVSEEKSEEAVAATNNKEKIDAVEKVKAVAVTEKVEQPKEEKVAVAEVKNVENKEVIQNVSKDVLVLKPIIFDYESSYLNKKAKQDLRKIVSIMKQNPNLVVECASFTDAKGSDKYNQWMSDRRAKRTVDYIVARGISPSRITGKGYGESQLINPCTEDANCTDAERAVNRRTEFVVVEK